MSNAKHTPGPYPLKAEQVPNDGQAKYLVVTNQGNHFATTYDPTAARLIAAAPELLAALERIAELSYDSEATRVAREAIAKARGE